MELIIIKGKPHRGKTTTLVLLHNRFVREQSNVIVVQPHDNILSDGREACDFISVHDFLGKRIAIISRGDIADDLYESMAELIETFHPDIMVVCMHTKNYPNSSNRMLHEEYGALIKDESIFEPIYTEDESKKIDEKLPMVDALYQHIVQTINTLKNE
ncbi:MAG: hypothetical protein IKR33_03765 [Bacteroidales bacterium]|nr:hypothetical protein [Bacteroidales bacterium]